MTHRFPIKEIARQSGLGPATVDRVLNNRAHVSPQTRRRVEAAITELTAQEAQLTARGRRIFFDFVVEAPSRFSREVRSAAEALLPQIGTAACRLRFAQQEVMTEDEVVATLTRIMRRGSQGVCLKARDTPKIQAAVNLMTAAKIPVVTLVTDITRTDRLTYVGLDNAGAGRTAAYLIAQTVQDKSGAVLTTRSHERFLGEEARETAFLAALKMRCPQLRLVQLRGGSGVDFETSKILEGVIGSLAELRAVYSMGGGNRSILDQLGRYNLKPDVYVAHDLDRDNRGLISESRLDYILHHDLQADIKDAFDAFLCYHRLSTDRRAPRTASVQVITPENVPIREP